MSERVGGRSRSNPPQRPRFSPPVAGGEALEKRREFGWRLGGQLDLGFSLIFSESSFFFRRDGFFPDATLKLRRQVGSETSGLQLRVYT
jgi:hypothetical protein